MVLNKTCLSTPLFLQVLYLQKKKKNICRSSAVCRGNLRLSAEGDPRLGYFSFGDAPRLPALPAGSGAAVDAEGPVTAALLSGGGAGGARAAVPRGGRPGPLPPPPEPAQGPGPLLPGRCGGREGGEGFSSALSSAPVPGVSPGQRARGRTGALGGAAGGGAGGTAGRLRLPCRGRVSSELPSLLFPSSGSAAIVCGAELTR